MEDQAHEQFYREASVLAVEAGSGLQLAAYLVASDTNLASASSTQQAQWRDAVRQQRSGSPGLCLNFAYRHAQKPRAVYSFL
jgi:hypothetical protein